MVEYLGYYAMAGVYIAAGVLGVAAVVAIAEKVLGLNTRPRITNRP